MAPKTEPWGTPHEAGSISEKQFPILRACRPPVRYEDNQRSAVPDVLYQLDKRIDHAGSVQ